MNTKIQKSFLLAESGVYWRILTKYEHKNSKILFCGANLPQHSLQNRENCFVSSKFTADIMLGFFNTLFYCGIILTVADLHKTRMHSNRMRTVCCSSRLPEGGNMSTGGLSAQEGGVCPRGSARHPLLYTE